LAEWSNYDWSARGEEWTQDTLWKDSIVKEVLEPNVPLEANILEIGPGAGRWTEYLVRRAEHLTLVDLTPECIRLCKKRFGDFQNVSYFVNDGKDLSFIPGQSIDRIWSFDVFVHIQARDIENYVKQFSTILAPGGRGIVHHSGKGALHEGWRSDMTADQMVIFCRKYGLSVIEQFNSWGDGIHHVRDSDVVTIFEKPTTAVV